MQILVLGMRSGSSVITRLINLMGPSVGPSEQLMKPSLQNPKGFWENEVIVRLNNRLLKAQQCTWNSIGNLQEALITPASYPEMAEEARKILHDFDKDRPWVIKDPRISLLLPFWRPLLDQPVFVIVYRQPLEVAHSLETHHNIPLVAGLALWEQYMCLSLRHSRGAPRIFVSYNAIMCDPVGEVARMYDWMRSNGVRSIKKPNQEDIESFIDPTLYREKSSEDEIRGLLSNEQQHLYAALLDESALQWNEAPKLTRSADGLLKLLDELLLRRWNEKVYQKRLLAADETIASLEAALKTSTPKA